MSRKSRRFPIIPSRQPRKQPPRKHSNFDKRNIRAGGYNPTGPFSSLFFGNLVCCMVACQSVGRANTVRRGQKDVYELEPIPQEFGCFGFEPGKYSAVCFWI